MNFKYALCPLVIWLMTGVLKLIIRWARNGKSAITQFGTGGFPSNHTAIIAATTIVIALGEGVDTPATGLGLALLMIVIFDATSLRRQVGKHAAIINAQLKVPERLRVRIGHSWTEVMGGLVWGALFGLVYHEWFPKITAIFSST